MLLFSPSYCFFSWSFFLPPPLCLCVCVREREKDRVKWGSLSLSSLTPSHQRQTKTLKAQTHLDTHAHTHTHPGLGLVMDNTVSGVHHHTHRYSALTFAVRSQQSALASLAPACKTSSVTDDQWTLVHVSPLES